ncbi:nitrilase-related carbon-nitrogen hydrolase, partial [Pseudomonas sp. SIMBA_021]
MTSPAKLTVALVQQSNNNNADENMAKSIKAIREAAQKGAQLVVLQEL